jgi:predicted enzyme related to lactoylglutathione lyase
MNVSAVYRRWAAHPSLRFPLLSFRFDEEENPMDSNPVGWFEIYVQDMTRAKAFYETIFEVKLAKLNSPEIEMWGFPMAMDKAGCSGSLVSMRGVPSGGNSTIVYFTCADCAVEQGRVTQAGGQVHRAKFSIGEYGFIALVVDTEGNMLGLHSQR